VVAGDGHDCWNGGAGNRSASAAGVVISSHGLNALTSDGSTSLTDCQK
jgi:hypothetical protein